VDGTFRPTLSSRIQFPEYSSKALSRGVVLKAIMDGVTAGVAIFYANDQITRSAYLSVLAVLPTHARRGIGKELVREAMAIAHSAGMMRMSVQLNPENQAASALYSGLGFRRCDKPEGGHVRPDSVFMQCRL
jgi:ribosomal protein S18 acetylase RimI-like enzyme